jgi:hypothetical protein
MHTFVFTDFPAPGNCFPCIYVGWIDNDPLYKNTVNTQSEKGCMSQKSTLSLVVRFHKWEGSDLLCRVPSGLPCSWANVAGYDPFIHCPKTAQNKAKLHLHKDDGKFAGPPQLPRITTELMSNTLLKPHQRC